MDYFLKVRSLGMGKVEWEQRGMVAEQLAGQGLCKDSSLLNSRHAQDPLFLLALLKSYDTEVQRKSMTCPRSHVNRQIIQFISQPDKFQSSGQASLSPTTFPDEVKAPVIGTVLCVSLLLPMYHGCILPFLTLKI